MINNYRDILFSGRNNFGYNSKCNYPQPHSYKYHAFTLIEMLVVIAIIGIIASMLMPSLQNAMEAGRQISCVNNLRQTGMGMAYYANDHANYLVPCTQTEGTGFKIWTQALAKISGSSNEDSLYVPLDLFVCPSQDLVATSKNWYVYRPHYGVNTYLYPSAGSSPSGCLKLTKYKSPSKKIWLSDCQESLGNGTYDEDQGYFRWYSKSIGYCNSGWGDVVGRHNRCANILRLDGNVSALTIVDPTHPSLSPGLTTTNDMDAIHYKY